MSQQTNMSGMGGMGSMSGMGGIGPTGAPAGTTMSNQGTPGGASLTPQDIRTKFHTFIYDYFLKTNRFDLARQILHQLEVDTSTPQKPSPNRKEINGDSIDSDSKEDVKKPDDLPLARVPGPNDSAFIYDWFCQFWDLYEAQRSKGTTASRQFLMASQSRMMTERRLRVDPGQMQSNMGGMRNGIMPNGMPVSNDMARKMMMQGRNPTPQQMQQMQQMQQSNRMQQMMQTQMQREGSAMDINGQPRAQSPVSGEAAPSPKRQRLEGSFNGAPIGPLSRGQAQGMPGQQSGSPQLATAPAKSTQQVEYSQGLRQHLTNALNSNMNKGMPGAAPVMGQGSPGMDSNVEFINGTQIRPGAAAAAAAQQGGSNSNHALQDYQMQLMLLEQQNKKRLLMARQEQDNMTGAPGGPVPPGQPGAFAPAMSPNGSRAGLSPNSTDQMKRGTPKMSQGAVPSPTPDASMQQGRASPAPGFDPSMNPNMPQNMFPQMNKVGMMGPNGQMMQPPPSSHPNMAGMNPQQMEMFARVQQNGGRMPNGFMPQGPPPMMPGQQPGGPMQHPPNMTPQQRNAAMPPPPAPTGDPGRGTQPSSPQQPQAPPTPSQGKNAKGKKDNKSNKKAPAKKGNTGATPVSEADQPPTPTPAPPITPTSTQAFPPKNAQQPNQPQQPNPQNAQNPLSQQQQPDIPVGAGPFGNLDGTDFGMNLDFGIEGSDVLDNFDFDSFLNNDAGDGNFGFDANMGFDTGLEAGGDV